MIWLFWPQRQWSMRPEIPATRRHWKFSVSLFLLSSLRIYLLKRLSTLSFSSHWVNFTNHIHRRYRWHYHNRCCAGLFGLKLSSWLILRLSNILCFKMECKWWQKSEKLVQLTILLKYVGISIQLRRKIKGVFWGCCVLLGTWNNGLPWRDLPGKGRYRFNIL